MKIHDGFSRLNLHPWGRHAPLNYIIENNRFISSREHVIMNICNKTLYPRCFAGFNMLIMP